MSMVPRCVRCDARVNPYGNDVECVECRARNKGKKRVG